MTVGYGIAWTDFVEFCGHAKDGLEAISKGCEWRNLAGALSEDQLEYCQNLISHGSLGLSLPDLGTDICDLYNGTYKNACLHMNKTVGGALHVWKDLSALSYASLGSLETPVDFVCEVTDMVGNIAELAKEVGEATWAVSFEDIEGMVFKSQDRPSNEFCVAGTAMQSTKTSGVNRVNEKRKYDCKLKDQTNRSWCLCLKTAAIVSSIALGVIGIATLLGGEAIVAALIAPVGILALGSAALVLKVAGNVFEKVVCGPCQTC